MKSWIRIAMLVTLAACGTIVPSARAAGAGSADDNMTPYRKLAADTLAAVQGPRYAHRKKEGPGA